MQEPARGRPLHRQFACRVRPKHVGKVSKSVDRLDGAPLIGAGVIADRAVEVPGAHASDLAAAFGIGGLSCLAVQYAVSAGATVVASLADTRQHPRSP